MAISCNNPLKTGADGPNIHQGWKWHLPSRMPWGKSPEKNSQQGWLPGSQLQGVNWPHAVEGKKPMGRYSASITIKEMKIKTRLRYDLTRLRTAILKRFSKIKRCRWRGEQGTLLHRGRGCKWVGVARKENIWRLLKTQNGELSLFKQPHSLLLSGKRPNSKGHVHPPIFGAALVATAKTEH